MKKIVISKLLLNDKDCVFDLLQDEKAMKYIGPRRALTHSECEIWFNSELDEPFRFVFRHVETQEVVGFCGVKEIDGELDFGYFIRRQYWGQGFSKIMCKEVIEKIRPIIPLNKVKVFIASSNIASIKVAESFGWKKISQEKNKFESGHLYNLNVYYNE